MKSKQGSSKRQLQERNFEIVVNHITINEDQLLQVSRQSLEALKKVFGHNIKKYSGTSHHKPDNDHVHFLVMSEAPKTESAVAARIAASMALIFGTKTGSVEVKMFNEVKADAGPAHGLKGLGNYRSLYVSNNDHENHRPKDAEHRTVEFMCGGEWEISHGGPRKSAGRQGPVQVVTAAIKARTPEFQCQTFEEYERLLEAAADSVGCTKRPCRWCWPRAPLAPCPSLWKATSFATLPMMRRSSRPSQRSSRLASGSAPCSTCKGPTGACEKHGWLLMSF